MSPFWEAILRSIVEAVQARRLIEIGVALGLMTAKALDYCAASDAVLHAIDPNPEVDIGEWRERHRPRLVFHQAHSLDVLAEIHDADVVLIDGDHNWFTVFHELRLIEETARTDGAVPPVIALHDVDWPYGRRDMYYEPERIPEAHRHPYRKVGLLPGKDELVEDGVNGEFNNAVTEHAPHNGVRTAIEDFAAQSPMAWQVSYVPGFHGLAIAVTADRLASNESLRAAIDSVQTTRFHDAWARELELARIGATLDANRWVSQVTETIERRLRVGLQKGGEHPDRVEELLLDAERRLTGVPDLEARVAGLERDLADAREEARVLDQRVSMGNQVLADVFNSPSWRLTQPLRTAKHSVARLRASRRR